MKLTKLIEFKNNKDDILRGILTYNNDHNNRAVLMAGGFERSATTEKKFKILADELIKIKIPSLRFDYTGVGLSDGDFSKTTVEIMNEDFEQAYNSLKKEAKCENISVMAHSLSTCVVASIMKELVFEKIIFMAPALNQRDLLRYWFVVSSSEKVKPDLRITWQNYKDYLNEELFLKDCMRSGRMTKTNYISADYCLENKNKDYSELLTDKANVLYIHGDSDTKVPKESLRVDFVNKIIIKDGDHNIERPDMSRQWLDKVVDFITS